MIKYTQTINDPSGIVGKLIFEDKDSIATEYHLTKVTSTGRRQSLLIADIMNLLFGYGRR